MKCPVESVTMCTLVKREERWGSDSLNTERQWRNATKRTALLCMPESPDTKWSGSLPKWRKLHQTSPTEGLWKFYISTGHDKPGLRLNLRQYLVPPSHMTLPIKSLNHPVLRIMPPLPFRLITLYHVNVNNTWISLPWWWLSIGDSNSR